MSYMSKKTQKRQSAIVSLSDRNAFEIQQINNQKAKMLKDYEEKKSGIMTISFQLLYSKYVLAFYLFTLLNAVQQKQKFTKNDAIENIIDIQSLPKFLGTPIN